MGPQCSRSPLDSPTYSAGMRSHPHQHTLRSSSAGPTFGSRLHSHPISLDPNNEPHVIDIGRPAPNELNHNYALLQDGVRAGSRNTGAQQSTSFRTPSRHTRINGMTPRRNAIPGIVSPCTPGCQFCPLNPGDSTPSQHHAGHNSDCTSPRGNMLRHAHSPRSPQSSTVTPSEASSHGRQTL